MAASALLRSVARKIARAPPPMHPLARGLRDGARSGPGSLPPPTSDQQGMADRLAVGMAAAAGLRSGGLPSLARKIARAPPQGYHRRLLYKRGLHSSTSPNPGASGSTPPPTSDKDLIENLHIRLSITRALAGAFGSVAVYLYFWSLPEAKAQAYSRRKSSNRDDSLTHAIESILAEHAENMQSSEHGGTRVDKSEVDQVLKAFPVMKEISDDIKDIQATSEAIEVSIKNHRAAAAELTAALESFLPEGELKELLSAEKNE